MGGVRSGEDAIEIIMVGATLVGVGSAVFGVGNSIFGKIYTEMDDKLTSLSIKSLTEIRGCIN